MGLLLSVDFFVSLITSHLADSVLEHDVLVEEVVYSLLALSIIVHRTLEEETQEALYAVASGACSEVHEQREVEQQRCCEDGVAAEEVDLYLHRIAHPAEYVEIIPSLLIIIARWIIVDTHLVVDISVEVGMVLLSQDCLESREL